MTFCLSKGEAKQAAKTTQTQSDEEAFLIRRIAEFWKDGDFGIVKTQIVDFLDKYPKDYFTKADMQVVDYCYNKAGR